MLNNRRNLIILIVATVVIFVGIASFVIFAYPQLLKGTPFEQKLENPLIGQWQSEHSFYGKHELLEFDKIGQIKDGRRVATSYDIHGETVIVTSGDKVITYKIGKNGLKLMASLPRVGNLVYFRVQEPVVAVVPSSSGDDQFEDEF